MSGVDGVDFSTGLLADLLIGIGWILFLGVPASWIAGIMGAFGPQHRMTIYTPLITACVGSVILTKLQSWPF